MFIETVVESAPMARFTKAGRMNLEVTKVRSSDAGEVAVNRSGE